LAPKLKLEMRSVDEPIRMWIRPFLDLTNQTADPSVGIAKISQVRIADPTILIIARLYQFKGGLIYVEIFQNKTFFTETNNLITFLLFNNFYFIIEVVEY
jgi:hypothetical protein